MLVYREDGREVDARRELARLRMDGSRSLIDVGAFEAAVVDALMPERDDLDPLATQLRSASLEAARAWIGTSKERRALDAIDDERLPQRITLRVAEGFAYYALFPEAYVVAARKLARARRFERACVIGLRSIGTTLSAAATVALESEGCDVSSYTVRPHGHPSDRVLALTDDLANAWRSEAARGATFILVDEGPGLSGSSFAALIEALLGLGVPVDRIVAMPSWNPDAAALSNARARRAWEAVEKAHAGALEAGISPERAFGVTGATLDWSQGRWRAELFPDEGTWPAVNPQHERWKVFVPESRRVLKFVGLGSHGATAHARAERLAELGLGPSPGLLRDGFLDLPFVDGTPIDRCRTTANAAHVGDYIGRVAQTFPTDEMVDTALLAEMIRTNLGEAHGDLPEDLAPALDGFRADLHAALIDGRMLAHEWIMTSGGLLKVDALDHARDHFFPGAQSPAWDLAAAAIELRMSVGETDAMMHAYEKRTSDPDARRALAFHELAYSAFRLGYMSLALDAHHAGDERVRLLRARARYSQCALNAAASFTAASKSPRKQIARSSMKT